MTTETPVQAKSSCRWTRILLFVSLAVNFVIVGVVAGAFYHAKAPGGAERVALRDPGAALFLSALEPADRRAMVRRLREEGLGPVEARREARAQFDALVAALRADPFDAAAVQEVIDAQASTAEARRSVGQRVFVERVEQMSNTERAAFADRLEKTLRHRGKPDHKSP